MDTPDEKERITFPQVSRRSFLQATSALITLPFISYTAKAQSPDASPEVTASVADKVVPTCSTFDCGGKCDIRAHMRDGVVTQITTLPDNELIHKCRLCAPVFVVAAIVNLFIIQTV